MYMIIILYEYAFRWHMADATPNTDSYSAFFDDSQYFYSFIKFQNVVHELFIIGCNQ